ncbi:phosphoserine phosphatase SerB [Shewanella sp. 202IG2-18]|uniref:phosphoserine phosphatase SerB n=1 Tax=Parashewanella hymeniacidonis TaxID=2807618 RepID=UPI00195F76AC|nr:phosphoserine phosphatase SerB [Parashewanella hymeniacidonis]MBM7071681.1 phosphoserine phosphatase SerB [Parashewanella hymeniacidonis]
MSALFNWLKNSLDSQFLGLTNQVTRYQEGQTPFSSPKILRLVWKDNQLENDIEHWLESLKAGFHICTLKRNQALNGIEICLTQGITVDQLNSLKLSAEVEVFEIKEPLPQLNLPGVLVMDMDSTAIQIECIDELAKMAGVGEAVSQVTEKAMAGELDFEESLRERVSKLKGTPFSIVEDLISQLPLTAGLTSMCYELQKHNWKIALASGGFTPFVNSLKNQLNLSAAYANHLEVEKETLTGKVLGKVVDANFKAEVISLLSRESDISEQQTVAIGDGANDIPMLERAKIGVAFHAKELVNENSNFQIKHLGLGVLLYLVEIK